MNWNDLKYLLAVQRGGSLLQAARLLGVDKSTVARRLAALETALGQSLSEHARDGCVTLTALGRQAARRAEAVEDQTRALAGASGNDKAEVLSPVRLTAVPLLVNHILLPHLPALSSDHPDIRIELISEARDLSLLDRDADIALRLARPRTGGQAVLARRLGYLDYGCYVAVSAGPDIPWIGYEPRMHHLDHATAIETLAARPGQRRAALSVNDAETLLQATRAGWGQTLLPRLVAAAQHDLEERACGDVPLPRREVWLLVRRDMRALSRIEAVTDWLARLFA